MSKLIDFFKKCKVPLLWTIGYVFVLWVVLHILFNFELFSARDWIRISHAHLRGLGGFTFSLIILAAIPLYIATTIIVIRTQKPLLALPMPKIVAKILEKLFPKQMTEPEKNTEKTESITHQPTIPIEQSTYPAEMQGAVTRARVHPNRINTPICSACSVNPNVYPADAAPTAPTFPDDDMPLPPDFDTDDVDTAPTMPHAPVFQDINFDDDFDTPNTPDNVVTKHLHDNNVEFNILPNDIILTDKNAIAIHDDNDFWIMDDPTWFAAGKTRESPILGLLDAAQQHNVRPILFLNTTNIMNLDAKRTEWESKGITVITDLGEL